MKQTQTEWILARLKQGPVTAIDALEGCGCFRLAARIADWREDAKGGRTLKVYELGPGKDMPKPKPRPRAEACAKWRAKQRAAKMLQLMAANNGHYEEAA